jgi:preprotein translocase subunit SecA
MVSKAIQQAQVKVEGFHFDSRKHLVEYDDVLNKHREIIYRLRRKALTGENQKDSILTDIDSELSVIVNMNVGDAGVLDIAKIVADFIAIIPFDPASQTQLETQISQLKTSADAIEFLSRIAHDMYEAREKQMSPEVLRQVERWVSLTIIDNLWMEHLEAIDDLREGIGLRGYGQRDPLVEYKNEAYSMFERLVATIKSEIVHRIFKVQVQMQGSQKSEIRNPKSENTNVINTETAISKAAKQMRTNQAEAVAQPVTVKKQLGRNDPCWCGSGKKWKKCHYPELK